MTAKHALELLQLTPYAKDDKPSAVNPSLTRQQAVEIVTRAVLSYPADDELPDYISRRVRQVCENRCSCGFEMP